MRARRYFSHLASAITITAPAAPSFTLTGPTSGTFTAGQTVTIQWTDANIDAGSTISLAYDTTTNWGNPKWIEIDGGDRGQRRGIVQLEHHRRRRRGPTTWPATCMMRARLTSPTSPRRSRSRRRPPQLHAHRPHLGNVYRGADGDDPMDRRQRRCGEHDQPGLRHDHQLGQPEVDRDRWRDGGQRRGSYSWNTSGVAAGTYYLAGYLYEPGQGYISHLGSAITITAPAAPSFTLTGPASGDVYRGADGDDPMDRRQCPQRQHDQPGLRHDQQLG